MQEVVAATASTSQLSQLDIGIQGSTVCWDTAVQATSSSTSAYIQVNPQKSNAQSQMMPIMVSAGIPNMNYVHTLLIYL